VLRYLSTAVEASDLLISTAINVEAAAKLGVTRRVAGVDGARQPFREFGLES